MATRERGERQRQRQRDREKVCLAYGARQALARPKLSHLLQRSIQRASEERVPPPSPSGWPPTPPFTTPQRPLINVPGCHGGPSRTRLRPKTQTTQGFLDQVRSISYVLGLLSMYILWSTQLLGTYFSPFFKTQRPERRPSPMHHLTSRPIHGSRGIILPYLWTTWAMLGRS